MILRQLKAVDLPVILAIEEATQFSPWTLETFERCFAVGYPFWGIELEQKLIGFIIFSLQAGEQHILNFAVERVYQSQGYGRALLQYVLQMGKQKGAGIVYLEVRRSNERAIKLYRQMDFTEVSVRKDYYPAKKGREDALVFALDLAIL